MSCIPEWKFGAYVDGELTQARAAAVARAVAADPALAAQVEALRRLKAAAAKSRKFRDNDLAFRRKFPFEDRVTKGKRPGK